MSKLINKALLIIAIIFVPIIILMSAVRLLMTPQYIQIEYSTPNYPVDRYGFTQDDRRLYAPVALKYLLNDADISFLGDKEFPDGSKMYNERELGHMEDVKVLTQNGLSIWATLTTVMILFGFYMRYQGRINDLKTILGIGGKITVALIALVLAFIAINFDKLFIGFHTIFFEGDSWLFYFSDTLIRLFPIRFWQDAFISMGVITLVAGSLLWHFFGRGHPSS